jgi:L-seryl-tRNA(Ser) seleniumtransferase
VAALQREPFFRALRCDKLILSALQATVDLYLSGAAEESVPILVMLRASNDELRIRASRIVAALAGLPLEARAGEGGAQVGGGTLPRSVIASVTVELRPAEITVGELAIRLRKRTPPVIGYLSGGVFKLDLRTVFPDDDGALVAAVHAVLDPVPQPVP